MKTSKKKSRKLRKGKKNRQSQKKVANKIASLPESQKDVVKDKPDIEMFKGIFRFPSAPFWEKLIFILVICAFHLALAYIIKTGILAVIKIGFKF